MSGLMTLSTTPSSSAPTAPPDGARSEPTHPVPALTEVTPAAWREANRRLLAKALGEWCFEGILDAVPTAHETYRVDLRGGMTYSFRATPGAFGWLRVQPDSIGRSASGRLGIASTAPAWDALLFVVDAASTIETDGSTLAVYLTELSSTLAVDAARIEHGGETVAAMRELGHAELDGRMTGHSWLVANKGRLGFSATDVRTYAPESGREVRLRWIAVHRGLAEFRATSELSERDVTHHELDAATRERHHAELAARGLDPGAYVGMPVHPWQWDHTVQVLHAADVASDRIVDLGEVDDRYLPGQSIRTMVNVGAPARFDVKLPLRIMNTLVWRGIPPHCSMGAPVITEWLLGLMRGDAFLTEETRTVFLGEVASVTVRHPYLSEIADVPYQHLETLGCIWREPVEAHADDGEKVRSFSSLLHVDEAGDAFVAELARRSGLAAETWLRRFFDTVLTPVIHVLYTYGITFNPHGQNMLIGFDASDVPVRLYLKDFVDDVNVTHDPFPERGPDPDGYDHLLPRKHASMIKQHVVDAILVGHFRYLAPLCADQLGVGEVRFWELVRATITAYHERFPDLAERFAEIDLLSERFPRFTLNRDRIVVTRGADRAQRQALEAFGELPNPLARPGRPTLSAVMEDR